MVGDEVQLRRVAGLLRGAVHRRRGPLHGAVRPRVFENIIQTVTQLTTADGKATSGVDIASWFEPVRILGYTALIGAVNVMLITALATLGAVIYNIASDLVGGVEVTFSEAE
ncbi:hypothetical protein GCM10018952_52770 [Streptosporangium vulgare]